MKIRQSYVSNSSSSSFIIIGKKVCSFEDDKEYVAVSCSYLSEGHDIFVVEENMKKFILDHIENFTIYEGIGFSEYSTLSWNDLVLKLGLKKGYALISETSDHSSSESLSDLEERYS